MAVLHVCECCRRALGIDSDGELVVSREHDESSDGANILSNVCDAHATSTLRMSEKKEADCIDQEQEVEVKRPKLSASPTYSHNTTPTNPSRQSYCVGCLDILNEAFVLEISTSVPTVIQQNGYVGLKSFSVAIHAPLSLMIRRMGMEKYVQKSKNGQNSEHVTFEGYVKEELRTRLKGKLEKSLSLPYELDSEFQVIVKLEHSQSMKECQQLASMYPDFFKKRKKRERFHARNSLEKDITIIPVRNALDVATVEEFSQRGYLLPPVGERCSFGIELLHKPLYIGGRYNKYSRLLSQTPWIVDGVRKTESSVQELVCEQLCKLTRCSGHTFLASGREDVDVRMLGTGRPFAVELSNPRNICLSREDLNRVQESINKSTDLIVVRMLTEVSKEETSQLKEGEAEKNKQYCALIWSEKEITATDLACLENIKGLKIAQKTPIRVLHRRPLAVRERTVYSMHSEIMDSHRFKLYLCTQAGTYIKEFVHSDFGRTKPSLGVLLSGREVDILSLDVTAVQLDWPPCRMETAII